MKFAEGSVCTDVPRVSGCSIYIEREGGREREREREREGREREKKKQTQRDRETVRETERDKELAAKIEAISIRFLKTKSFMKSFIS